MTRPGIEPRSPGRLANTLTPRPMSGTIYIYMDQWGAMLDVSSSKMCRWFYTSLHQYKQIICGSSQAVHIFN